jgi:TPR repeat protein
MYAKGDGIAQNIVLAARWFEKAAAQGEPFAQANLSAMYARGYRCAARSGQEFRAGKGIC